MKERASAVFSGESQSVLIEIPNKYHLTAENLWQLAAILVDRPAALNYISEKGFVINDDVVNELLKKFCGTLWTQEILPEGKRRILTFHSPDFGGEYENITKQVTPYEAVELYGVTIDMLETVHEKTQIKF